MTKKGKKENKFTLGFIFDTSLQNVLLIHKERPTWQKGKVNGIGGKYEKEEDSVCCISREVQEETTLTIAPDKWTHVGVIKQGIGDVDVLTTMYSGDAKDAKSTDEEIVRWYGLNQLPENIVNNLEWLILLARDKLKNDDFRDFVVWNKD